MRRLSYEEVMIVFEENGCALLSDEYKGAKSKLRYVCTCGEESEIAFDKFKRGQRCRKCSFKKTADKLRKPLDEVRLIFEQGGCELLSTEYIGNKQKLEYVCECGNTAEIALSKFMAGQRCQKCKLRKISEAHRGEKHHGYKHDRTDEERIKQRKYPAYLEWRRNVYERDKYTCINCCEDKRNINAHHIYSYAKYPELRTDLRNGITLCEDCHKQFHRAFGQNDFLPEHTTLFLSGVLDECPC